MAQQRRSRVSSPRLFDPGQLALRATGPARLRDLARLPRRPATHREQRSEEDAATMKRLRRWGDELCAEFGLRYLALEAEQDGVNEHYGVCYEDGLIRIRLRHARTGALLKESSLVDTLCHELAHLRHLDHSLRFRRLYDKILELARSRGIYCPGPEESRGPTQLSLFDTGCATAQAREKTSNRRR